MDTDKHRYAEHPVNFICVNLCPSVAKKLGSTRRPGCDFRMNTTGRIAVARRSRKWGATGRVRHLSPIRPFRILEGRNLTSFFKL
jgi:hypothetical protein